MDATTPLSPEELERYARHIVLPEIGGAGQQKLKRARVLVIGAGGLGAPMLQYLAAAGVGTLGIVDDDTVSLSNLQRQVIHDTASVGKSKLDSARTSIERINPNVSVELHNLRITASKRRRAGRASMTSSPTAPTISRRAMPSPTPARPSTRPLVHASVGRFDGQVTVLKPLRDGCGRPAEPVLSRPLSRAAARQVSCRPARRPAYSAR